MKYLKFLIIFYVVIFSAGDFVWAHQSSLFQIVVHPSNSIKSISQKFLSDIFLKKVKFWNDQKSIRPVDLSYESEIRKNFTEIVLNRSTSAVRNYWQQIIFSGRDIPPPELETEDEVVAYILKNENAIGYVSKSFPVKKLKTLTIE